MKYWKKITWGDTLNPGDILMCNSPAFSNVVIAVVNKCSEMTGITTVRWLRYGHIIDGIEGHWTFDYVVKYCKKLVIV